MNIWNQRFCLFLCAAFLSFYASGQKAEVDQLVKKYQKDHNFNGAVLIGKQGQTEYLSFSGLANRQDSIRYSPKSRFHIFSVTKTFTAVLILQLYEQNKIHLDSSIAKYYPEYKGEAAKKVSIRNLLTYSSGRDARDMREIAEAYNSTIWPVDTFIRRFCSEKLIAEPGTVFNYNNGDFVLLGKVIERLYGEPFGEVLRRKILVPLKMNDSGYLRHEDVVPHLDQAYFHEQTTPVTFTRPTNYYIDNYFSAGAMYSTPKDLLLFDQAIFEHKLLKKETVALMLSPNSKLGDVGFGFWIYPKKIGKTEYLVAERQGYGYGHHTNWVHLIDRDVTLILLSNTNTVDLNDMRWKLLEAYLQAPGKAK